MHKHVIQLAGIVGIASAALLIPVTAQAKSPSVFNHSTRVAQATSGAKESPQTTPTNQTPSYQSTPSNTTPSGIQQTTPSDTTNSIQQTTPSNTTPSGIQQTPDTTNGVQQTPTTTNGTQQTPDTTNGVQQTPKRSRAHKRPGGVRALW